MSPSVKKLAAVHSHGQRALKEDNTGYLCSCVCVFGRPISLLSLLQEIPSPPRYMERKEGVLR